MEKLHLATLDPNSYVAIIEQRPPCWEGSCILHFCPHPSPLSYTLPTSLTSVTSSAPAVNFSPQVLIMSVSNNTSSFLSLSTYGKPLPESSIIFSLCLTERRSMGLLIIQIRAGPVAQGLSAHILGGPGFAGSDPGCEHGTAWQKNWKPFILVPSFSFLVGNPKNQREKRLAQGHTNSLSLFKTASFWFNL